MSHRWVAPSSFALGLAAAIALGGLSGAVAARIASAAPAFAAASPSPAPDALRIVHAARASAARADAWR